MAAVAGIGKIRFRDTCAEAGRFLKRRDLGSNKEHWGVLAKLLQQEEKRWELLSRVWVELLSYAAGNCRANAHAQQDLKLETESEVAYVNPDLKNKNNAAQLHCCQLIRVEVGFSKSKTAHGHGYLAARSCS
ncbi:hypothetical protein OIU79_008265 [Salix purpurea]|uniref:Uncharacterized protein n=1 Tax=Salix purpurea TaxID=77065 RepID=A0A9Q0TI11_SALPP|nr:hypothetical protein OIU79_008265 [Salix purpurea]